MKPKRTTRKRTTKPRPEMFPMTREEARELSRAILGGFEWRVTEYTPTPRFWFDWYERLSQYANGR